MYARGMDTSLAGPRPPCVQCWRDNLWRATTQAIGDVGGPGVVFGSIRLGWKLEPSLVGPTWSQDTAKRRGWRDSVASSIADIALRNFETPKCRRWGQSP